MTAKYFDQCYWIADGENHKCTFCGVTIADTPEDRTLHDKRHEWVRQFTATRGFRPMLHDEREDLKSMVNADLVRGQTPAVRAEAAKLTAIAHYNREVMNHIGGPVSEVPTLDSFMRSYDFNVLSADKETLKILRKKHAPIRSRAVQAR